MTDRNLNKYRIEKVLHEWIRDLPEVRNTVKAYERGTLTFSDALREIAEIVDREREQG